MALRATRDRHGALEAGLDADRIVGPRNTVRSVSGDPLELARNRGQKLGDGRVDVHGARERIDVAPCGHHVKYGVDGLVASGPEYRRTQDYVAVRIRDDRHEAERLVLFDGAADQRHRALADQQPVAGRLCLGLCHAHPAERRVDVERVGCDAIADLAVRAVE